MEYIQDDKHDNTCIFCKAAGEPLSAENLVVFKGQSAYVILNRFPYTSGHIMVVPYSHQPSLELLEAGTRAEMMELASRAVDILRQVYRPQGFNLGINIGSAAGAGIADHVHLHVVPRWGGDTNFMSTLGDTRVLPETLEDTYRRIRAAWEAAVPT